MTEELPKGHYWHGCNSCGNEWHSKNTKMERCPKCKKEPDDQFNNLRRSDL